MYGLDFYEIEYDRPTWIGPTQKTVCFRHPTKGFSNTGHHYYPTLEEWLRKEVILWQTVSSVSEHVDNEQPGAVSYETRPSRDAFIQ